MFSEESSPVWKNAKAGYERVKTLDYEKNKIVWLEPAPANNTWAIAVRKDVATANKLKTLADMGKWISGGGQFKLRLRLNLPSALTRCRRFRKPMVLL